MDRLKINYGMKRFIMLLACCVFVGSLPVYAQDVNNANGQSDDEVMKVMRKNEQKQLYKAELEVAMRGLHMGAEYSYRTMLSIGTTSASKHGIHYLVGYRFTKHWYVGGITGLDITTPLTIVTGYSSPNQEEPNSVSRNDKVYIPIIADIRFYFNVNRVSTYLYANLGAEFSHSTSGIYLFGLGFDIHTTKAQCVNLSLGIGSSGYESVAGALYVDGPGYVKTNGFAFNLN